MFAPRADRLVKRIVGAGRAELDAVILPEPRDRGLVEDDLGDGGKLHPVSFSVVRWVTASNRRAPSSTSPKRSSRTGAGSPGGQTSMIPPRTA
jgi:hypothetical protein